MRSIEVHNVAAFTKHGAGGNAAGVVLEAEALSRLERQHIAKEVGFSETAFVERLPEGDLKLEFYTPNKQIDICGHATVGAFTLLREKGLIEDGEHRFHSVIGSHHVEVRSSSVGLWQDAHFSTDLDPNIWSDFVAHSLGVRSDEIIGPLRIASTGSPFLLIEMAALKSLEEMNVDQQAVAAVSERLNLVGYYVFHRDHSGKIAVRMFAPRYGIAEESATGMGAGALALSIHRENRLKELKIEQGHLMHAPSPSVLCAKIFGEGRVLILGEAVRRGVEKVTTGFDG